MADNTTQDVGHDTGAALQSTQVTVTHATAAPLRAITSILIVSRVLCTRTLAMFSAQAGRINSTTTHKWCVSAADQAP
eukprot:9337-Heterococcus_DN1.PRE.7